jgi:tRNA pseudouridine-54 N-methylase
MTIRRFLVCFSDFPIEEAQIRSGRNTANVVVSCRCVNVGLFLSGDMRRDVEVSIAIGTPSEMTVFSFPGNTIKRVSPDERSISFFLLKAKLRAEGLRQGQKSVLPNGIIVQKSDLETLIEQWNPKMVYLSEDDDSEAVKPREVHHRGLFIFDQGGWDLQSLPFLRSAVRLHSSHSPERFILQLNLDADDANRESV